MFSQERKREGKTLENRLVTHTPGPCLSELQTHPEASSLVLWRISQGSLEEQNLESESLSTQRDLLEWLTGCGPTVESPCNPWTEESP